MLTPQSFSLEGQTALVTGAGRGIGRAIAEGLAALGAEVAVAEIDDERRAEAVAAIRANGHRVLDVSADVRDARSVQRMVETVRRELGGIDILANNPGGMAGVRLGPLDAVDEESWHRILQLNLTSVYHVVHAVIPVMKQQKRGAIAIIASVVGLVGWENLSVYGAAKAGVVNLVRALAGELGPYGIRINAISPGTIDSPSVRAADERRQRTLGFRDPTAEMTPLGRLGLPDDIAGAVAYLVSPAAAYVSGQNLIVDGGRTAVGRNPVLPAESGARDASGG